jgi:phage protein D
VAFVVPGDTANGIGIFQPTPSSVPNAVPTPAPPSVSLTSVVKYKPKVAPARNANRAGKRPTTPAPAAGQPATVETDFYPVPAGSRRPRAYLKINGRTVEIVSLTTNSTSHFTPDSWTATLGLYQQPQGLGMAEWDKYDPATIVEVFIGFLKPSQAANEMPIGATRILTGLIDQITLNRTSGEVSLTGRDLTARLVDAKTADRFPNLTASQAVTKLAKQYGLTPTVTATTKPIGSYFTQGYSSMTAGTPVWDYITFLAQMEGYDAYVENQNLYFGPLQADVDPSPWVFWIQDDGRGRVWGNVTEMTLSRNANLAKDISVIVLTHNAQTGRSGQYTASKAGVYLGASSRSRSADTIQSYVFRKPGLSAEQAQAFANTELAELSRFEREFIVTLEGSAEFNVRKPAKIKGTSTDFDTKYYIRTIGRTFGKDGFTMTITGKNAPAENETAVPGEAA